jgi:hypothetical protein
MGSYNEWPGENRRAIIMNIADLRIGSLIIDRQGIITQIKSLEGIRIEYGDSFSAPFYHGLINGEPARNFKDCPITRGLLTDLGWQKKKESNGDVITMFPPANSFYSKNEMKEFPVHFVLRDYAIEGYKKGHRVIKSTGSEDFLEIETMTQLDGFYYECFKIRMQMNVREYQTIFTDPSWQREGN